MSKFKKGDKVVYTGTLVVERNNFVGEAIDKEWKRAQKEKGYLTLKNYDKEHKVWSFFEETIRMKEEHFISYDKFEVIQEVLKNE